MIIHRKHLSYIFQCFLDSASAAVVVVIVRWLDLELLMQSVPITTNVVSLNPVLGEVYSIQHYEIKFAIDLQHVGVFFRVLWFPSPIKLTATI